MITRVRDGAPRGDCVAWDTLAYTVAVAHDNSLPMYEQAKPVFATITQNQKPEMDRLRADCANPAMRPCAATFEGRDLIELLVTAVRV